MRKVCFPSVPTSGLTHGTSILPGMRFVIYVATMVRGMALRCIRSSSSSSAHSERTDKKNIAWDYTTVGICSVECHKKGAEM